MCIIYIYILRFPPQMVCFYNSTNVEVMPVHNVPNNDNSSMNKANLKWRIKHGQSLIPRKNSVLAGQCAYPSGLVPGFPTIYIHISSYVPLMHINRVS